MHQRFSPNSITRDTARRLTSRIRLVEKNLDAFAAHPALLARQYRIIADGCRAAGDLAGARRWLGRALRVAPADPRSWGRALQATVLGLAPRGRAQASAPASSASK